MTGTGASGGTGFLGFKGRLTVGLMGMALDCGGGEGESQVFAKRREVTVAGIDVPFNDRGGNAAALGDILLNREEVFKLGELLCWLKIK
jgi:hypothetical protein